MTGRVSDRAFLSIGEVLDLLKVDFPDVTISKIRFLESQGLVDPERTPSGYRKFYDGDVERLRWILRQQREHFLPLKVIKDRLDRDGDVGADVTPLPEAGGSGASATDDVVVDEEPDLEQGPVGRADVLTSGMTSATFTREELGRASGCDDSALAELERYGLLGVRSAGGATYYDEEALIVARLAAAFARHGVEPRHLRMYKTAAEREAGFLEQVVLPTARQRDAVGRGRSLELLSDLVRLGDGLRGSLLRQALRSYTEQR